MEPDYKTMATDLLDSGMGDDGRLRFILGCIEKNKPLYKTDIRFLEHMTGLLETRIQRLQKGSSSHAGSDKRMPSNAPKPEKTVSKTQESHTSTFENPEGNVRQETKPREGKTRALISDEVLDAIIDRQNSKAVKSIKTPKKKKSFLARMFSRKTGRS